MSERLARILRVALEESRDFASLTVATSVRLRVNQGHSLSTIDPLKVSELESLPCVDVLI
jgi:hypothetical protein